MFLINPVSAFGGAEGSDDDFTLHLNLAIATIILSAIIGCCWLAMSVYLRRWSRQWNMIIVKYTDDMVAFEYRTRQNMMGNGNEDEGMPPSGRRGASGDEGRGGGKKGRGNQSDDELARLLNDKADLRDEDQKEQDRRRRLATQCIYVGWFQLRDGEKPTNPGSKQVYRRCAATQSAKCVPWCKDHKGLPDGDRSKDPGLPGSKPKDPKDPKDKKPRGLGMGYLESFLGDGKVSK